MSRTLLSLAGFQVILSGRFWVIAEDTIKFGPAVSQKELEKALHEDGETPNHTSLTKMKARIEIIGDFADLKRLAAILKELAEK